MAAAEGVRFILTSPPPSVNGAYRNVAGKGRVKTRKYSRWIKGELNTLLYQHAKPILGPVAITLTLPVGIRGDCDNRLKAAQDLLVRAGVIPSDDARVVVSVRAHRGESDRTILTVEQTETTNGR